MAQMTINDSYKTETRVELALLLQVRCMRLPFHLMKSCIQVSNPLLRLFVNMVWGRRDQVFIAKWVYEVVIPFNAIMYPSFQPMIEAIFQYGVGVKGPSIYEVKVTHLKKELGFTKESMKDHEMEWKKNGCSIMLDGWTNKKERILVNFLMNYSKGIVFMGSIGASSMIKIEKMFEHLTSGWTKLVKKI